jgi:hypothetical protein
MAGTPIHSKLITAAARQVLRPMGMIQKGQSRHWTDDHQWWVCCVEFQPSSWSRGSYLNVYAMWLWVVKDYWSHDEGIRAEGFAKFQNEIQFAAKANRLAERAAEELCRYRALFPNVLAVGKYYLEKTPDRAATWQTFHSGIACALADRPADAERFFDQYLSKSSADSAQWFIDSQTEAAKLRALVAKRDDFRNAIIDRVKRARALLKLPEISAINFD